MARLFKKFHHLPMFGKRPCLTIPKILAWADSHFKAKGCWPSTNSGPVRQSAFGESWGALDSALSKGHRGLPGGQTLARLLEEHRGVRRRLSEAGARRAAAISRRLREERRGCRATLSRQRILAWADAHRAATGRWPTVRSGPVAGVPGETWSTLDKALKKGVRGLRGPTNLYRFLVQYRGKRRSDPPDLTVAQVLAWADAYRAAHGRWPRPRAGRKIPGAAGESWATVDKALRHGRRGLPRPTTLTRFLVEHRGPDARNRPPDLTVEQVLGWADAYHATRGRWPSPQSGKVAGTRCETWFNIDRSLTTGARGMPGGSSLARLLAEHRGAQDSRASSDLSIEQIRAWGEAHRAATGQWPSARSGAVRGAPREDWLRIQGALWGGSRGLPGGMTLADVFGGRRRRRPSKGLARLSVAEILAWADAHHAAAGRWPAVASGPVRTASYPITWAMIDIALRHGYRGLPRGQSLSRLLREHRGHQPRMGPARRRQPLENNGSTCAEPRLRADRIALSLEQILAAADAYRTAAGRWPNVSSGPIAEIPGATWSTLNRALLRGLPGLTAGMSLARLLAQHRGRQVNGLAALMIEEILRWADAYREAHGCWPDETSGPVEGAPADTWQNISRLLARGGRGLPGATTLRRLLAEQRGVRYHGMEPDLNPEQIFPWAEAHRAATGKWPTRNSGPVAAAPGETWGKIDDALRFGRRGLPGGSSVPRVIAEHLAASSPDLSIATIAAWGDAYHARHGQWPGPRSGAVGGAPGEKWFDLDVALQNGSRGLPAGMSLAQLFEGRPCPRPGDRAGALEPIESRSRSRIESPWRSP